MFCCTCEEEPPRLQQPRVPAAAEERLGLGFGLRVMNPSILIHLPSSLLCGLPVLPVISAVKSFWDTSRVSLLPSETDTYINIQDGAFLLKKNTFDPGNSPKLKLNQTEHSN